MISGLAPTWGKKILIASYSVGDAAHGIDDCAICIASNATVIGHGGGGIYGIEYGGIINAWPLDVNYSGTVIIGEYPQGVGNQGVTGNPFKAVATYGWYFPGVNFTSYAWQTTGHWVDAVGQTSFGPGNITYDQTGIYITANNVTETGVAVNAAGGGYIVGDQVFDANGGQWQVTSIGASGTLTGIAPLSPARPGFAANCSGLTGVPIFRGSGQNATINITCSAPANQVTIGASGGTVNLVGTIKSGAATGLSCAAGAVTAATMVVTNGIVTHC